MQKITFSAFQSIFSTTIIKQNIDQQLKLQIAVNVEWRSIDVFVSIFSQEKWLALWMALTVDTIDKLPRAEKDIFDERINSTKGKCGTYSNWQVFT